MAILGISSATKTLSLALVNEARLLAELTVAGKQALTEDIVIYVEKLVNESQVKVSGVSVITGPGAYSGLRGGLAFAKTFAQVNNIPLAAVSTLNALAYNLRGFNCVIGAITDACQNDFNFAFFRSRKGKVERLTDDLVIHFDKLCALLSQIKGQIYLTGNCDEILAKVKEMDPGTLIDKAHINYPSGFSTALIGEMMIKEGRISDPLKLSPNYSHNPNIREFKT